MLYSFFVSFFFDFALFTLITATFQDLSNRLLSTDFSKSAFSVPPLSPRKSFPASTTFDFSTESLDDHSKVCQYSVTCAFVCANVNGGACSIVILFHLSFYVVTFSWFMVVFWCILLCLLSSV